MRPKKMLIVEFALILASSVNYATVTLMSTVWSLELGLLLPILITASFFAGLIALDIRKALIYACIAVILGIAFSTLVMVTPPILLGEGAYFVDSALNQALIGSSKFLVFAIVVSIGSALVGSLFADWFEPIEDYQI